MPIIHTIPALDFPVFAIDLINSTIPSTPKNILLYQLSKPDNWPPRVSNIQKQLGLSAHASRKGLQWLTANNYLQWQHTKSGQTTWQVCDKVEV
jgi:predicted ArsR family transcriptional regulator